MDVLKNVSIKVKLFLVYAVVSVIVFTISFSLLFYQVKKNLENRIKDELSNSNQIITDLIETTATVSIKNHLRGIAEKNREILGHLYMDYQKNKIPLSRAKEQAVKILLSQTIGETGYIYCINSKGIAVVHPNTSVLGRNFSERRFIKDQIKNKEGYLEYDWENPGESLSRPKALYMTYFEPWDWIISVSSYISEFTKLISINDFKDRVINLTFGKTGYSFIFDTKGSCIIHPQLTGQILNIKDAKGKMIFQEMIQKKKGFITYSWKNPGEKQAREKFVVFDYIPSFDWIIASSSYTKEILAPLSEMKKSFIIFLFFSIFATAAVSIVLSASLSKPLTALILRLEQGGLENWTLPIDEKRTDEIGRLAASFNGFIERLNAYRNDLVNEIRVRKKAQTQLQLFEKLFENTSEGICITDEKGKIEAVNQAFTTITGYQADEAIGENPRILKSDRHENDFYQNMWEALIQKKEWSGEIWNRRKNGEAYPELLSISAILDKSGQVKNYVGVFHDISEMKTKEKQIQHLAYHDPLTGLPNRILLKDRLKQAMGEAMRNNNMIQLLFIDLDNFKNVNDTIGHAKGDELLKKAAGRMLSITRIGDTVSRIGGDEFIIMVPHIKNESEIINMVERLQSVFIRPFSLGEHTFHITCSIGIAVFPNDGEDVETLIRNADLAMYQSKHGGKNIYHLFEKQMARNVRERVQLEADLRSAIQNNEFEVYFQPRVHNRTLKTVGMEALVRWIRSDGKIIAPNLFIPLAEDSGLIVSIGEIVFKKAVANAIQIRKHTGLDLFLSVNVSARQFDDQGFEKMVTTLLEETRFPPDRLEIEVTESLLMKDISLTTQRLLNLSILGVRTAIDDFGTGYSSLAYIKQLPISILKIDKSFIDDLIEHRDTLVLIETICLMAGKLNLSIVAEGVETKKQLEVLSGLGAMEIQGYVFARPMPMEQFKIWISENKKRAAQNSITP